MAPSAALSGAYSVPFGARCLSSVPASDAVRFYVGTASLVPQTPQLYRLDIGDGDGLEAGLEDSSSSGCVPLPREEEVRAVASSPTDEALLAVSGGAEVTLYHAADDAALKRLSATPGYAKARSLAWSKTQDILSLSHLHAEVVRVEHDALTPVHAQKLECEASAGCWIDPRSGDSWAVADTRGVALMDGRQPSSSSHAVRLRSPRTCDVDVNPNRRNVFASVGYDGVLKLWDVRQPAKPWQRLHAHPQWAHVVRFNPLHDDLLLSAGTDGVVQLWRVTSTASGEDKGSRDVDVTSSAKAFPDHDDSVYGMAWSSADEFVFATVSYDGRVVVNLVPDAIKNDVLFS